MGHKDFQGSTTAIIDSPWPEKDLEYVQACPICECDKRTLAYSAVKDWAFGCAPGSWNYWRCNDCQSLYLNPRPTQSSIGRAYGSYYTHTKETSTVGFLKRFKTKLRNECFFHWLGIDASPRLGLRFAFYLRALKPFIARKFPLDQLNHLPRGTLLDVGCGNGDLLVAAQAMGFVVSGLEIDPIAVQAASGRGLSVQQGSFDRLTEYNGVFDYIVCSHVVEHVHDPRRLAHLLARAIKPHGRVFISWPNPQSIALDLFGRYWRGLEAPRHICLMSRQAVTDVLQKETVLHIESYSHGFQTVSESWRLRKGRVGLGVRLIDKFVRVVSPWMPGLAHPDFLEICFQAPTCGPAKVLPPQEATGGR